MSAKEYHFFWRTKSPFSQWHPSSYSLDGFEYSTAEQGMMHGKALVFADEAIANQILKTTEPRKIKLLGRKVRGYSDVVWKKHRMDIVYRNNFAKFTQNDNLLEALLATRGRLLVEAAPNDNIWGIGMHAKAAKQVHESEWKGLNLLGKILTKVRQDILTGRVNGTTIDPRANQLPGQRGLAKKEQCVMQHINPLRYVDQKAADPLCLPRPTITKKMEKMPQKATVDIPHVDEQKVISTTTETTISCATVKQNFASRGTGLLLKLPAQVTQSSIETKPRIMNDDTTCRPATNGFGTQEESIPRKKRSGVADRNKKDPPNKKRKTGVLSSLLAKADKK